MPRFAKLPLALLAVLAMLFLAPGFARADDTPPDPCATTPAPDGCPAAATGTTTDSGTGDAATQTGTQPDVAPNAVTDPLPCDPTHLTDCIDCSMEPAKSLPPCTTTPPPPKTCEELTDLPLCVPDCAFLAHVIGQDICTTDLPQCLDPSLLPPDFPAIPGVPVCEASAPSTTPPPTSPGSGGVYYKNCADARAHGASNIHKGQPGYRPGLDRDHDGIACETSTSTGTPQTPAAPPPPAAQPVAAPAVDQLAYTGAVPAPIALAGFGLVLGGAGLLRLSRRTR